MSDPNEHEHNNQSKTEFLGSDIPFDTEIRNYQGNIIQENVPHKSRVMRFYMPQKPEPLVAFNVETLIIGRINGNNRLDLSLHYGMMLGVSREHAKIDFVDGQYLITDLDSSNGTYVNNRKLPAGEARELEHSDQLRFGHFVMIIGLS